jgi:hypothetical protein
VRAQRRILRLKRVRFAFRPKMRYNVLAPVWAMPGRKGRSRNVGPSYTGRKEVEGSKDSLASPSPRTGPGAISHQRPGQ